LDRLRKSLTLGLAASEQNTMRRREFIAGIGIAATWPLAGRAQRASLPVIGYISGRSREGDEAYTSALLDGLKQSGFVNGSTMLFDGRWTQGQYGQVTALTVDLVGKKAAVIVVGGTAAALAVKAATATVPIVFVTADDPVDVGLVTSLNRPSGNITGVGMVSAELRPKMLQLLREFVPQMKSVSILVNPNNSSIQAQVHDAQATANNFGLEMRLVEARTPDEIEFAFASLPHQQGLALLVASDPFLTAQHQQIVDLAARFSIPAIYPWREYAVAGGLISYGSSNVDAYRQAALSAANILKGTKPADLPVRLPTKYQLVINLRTAKALGLTVPPALLTSADEVIE
jgi:putative tryptophan/tyrosine transport system substrate-binding protein